MTLCCSDKDDELHLRHSGPNVEDTKDNANATATDNLEV